ncbi:hypothetical protein BFF94_025540 [Burkholderia catarinensis]|nr:hypothetical protein BFF94_025540 [Burkholderia catarinensis]
MPRAGVMRYPSRLAPRTRHPADARHRAAHPLSFPPQRRHAASNPESLEGPHARKPQQGFRA